MQKSPEREKISKLKLQSVIIVIPFDSSPTQMKKISKFEDTIDHSLRVDHPSDRYLGSYEGHDLATGEYRMFFSAPDAELLFDHLSSLLKKLKWKTPIKVFRRKGRIYDKNAPEETSMI